MAQEFELEAAVRLEHGKSAARRMRQENKVPGVIYGADKDPVSLTVEHHQLSKKLQNEAFYSHILNVRIDGKEEKAILRDVQRHPFKPRITHIDLLRISATQKLTMSVPLHFLNEDKAPGVKNSGGLVSHLHTSVEIQCLPADLPEYIEVDVAGLDIDESIHLSALKLPKGVEFIELLHKNDIAVVSIHLPRAAIEEEAAAAPEAPAEPEVITAKADKDEAE